MKYNSIKASLHNCSHGINLENRVRLSVVQYTFKQHFQLNYVAKVICSQLYPTCSKKMKNTTVHSVLRAMDKRLNRMSGPSTGIILFNAIIFCFPDNGLGLYIGVFTSKRYMISNYEGKNKQLSQNGPIRKKFPKRIVSRESSHFPRWPLSYPNLTKNMKTYIRS